MFATLPVRLRRIQMDFVDAVWRLLVTSVSHTRIAAGAVGKLGVLES